MGSTMAPRASRLGSMRRPSRHRRRSLQSRRIRHTDRSEDASCSFRTVAARPRLTKKYGLTWDLATAVGRALSNGSVTGPARGVCGLCSEQHATREHRCQVGGCGAGRCHRYKHAAVKCANCRVPTSRRLWSARRRRRPAVRQRGGGGETWHDSNSGEE